MTVVGDAIRKARRDKGWSQQALADRAGLSLDWVRSTESGRTTNPRMETVAKAALALGVSADSLVLGEPMAINRRVRKDGSVGWQVVIDEYDPVTRKRKRHVVGTFSPKKRAQKEERIALEAMDDSRFVGRSSTTVEDLVSSWLAHKQHIVTAQTHASYSDLARLHVLPHFGTVRVQELTPAANRAVNTSGIRHRERTGADSGLAYNASGYRAYARMRT